MKNFSQLDVSRSLENIIVRDEEIQNSVQSFLDRLVSNTKVHARFLNTISLLEHLGSRKILITQSHSQTDESVLQHASEEARHALFFKQKASSLESNNNLKYNNEDLYFGKNAILYFQRLDALVKRNLSREINFPRIKISRLNYLYTTILIEIRAYEFYTLYNLILDKISIGFHLNGIIREEEGHLKEMIGSLYEEDSLFYNRLDIFLIKEKQYFKKLLLHWANGIV